MKKVVFLLIVSVLLSSCLEYKYLYTIKIVEPPSGKVENESFIFESSGFESCSSVSYKITNKTNENIDVDWNRASFIVNGEAFRVYDGKSRISDSNKEQLMTRVPPNSFVTGVMISGKDFKYNVNTGWAAQCFFEKNDAVGQKVIVRVPVLVNGKSQDYPFTIEITNIVKVKQNILFN